MGVVGGVAGGQRKRAAVTSLVLCRGEGGGSSNGGGTEGSRASSGEQLRVGPEEGIAEHDLCSHL